MHSLFIRKSPYKHPGLFIKQTSPYKPVFVGRSMGLGTSIVIPNHRDVQSEKDPQKEGQAQGNYEITMSALEMLSLIFNRFFKMLPSNHIVVWFHQLNTSFQLSQHIRVVSRNLTLQLQNGKLFQSQVGTVQVVQLRFPKNTCLNITTLFKKNKNTWKQGSKTKQQHPSLAWTTSGLSTNFNRSIGTDADSFTRLFAVDGRQDLRKDATPWLHLQNGTAS